jgi:hypothetical protein
MSAATAGKKWVWGVIAACAAVGIVAAAVFWPRSAPKASGDIVKVVKYVHEEKFLERPEADRKPYVEALRKRGNEVDQALAAGKITKDEHATAQSYAWFARQVDHVEEYFRLTPGAAREKYWETRMAKYRKPKDAASAAVDEGPEIDDHVRDKVVERWLAQWEPDRRKQWDEYRKLSKEKKKLAAAGK